MRVYGTDVEFQLRRFDGGWISISLSEGAAEAKIKDEDGTVIGVIEPFGVYSGLACETRIGIRNLRTALNAGFRDFEVRRTLSESSLGLYLFGSICIPPTEPRLFEGERRERPTEVDVFILPAKDG